MSAVDLAVVGLRAETIADAARLAEVRPAWEALFEDAACDNPFLLPEWVLPWWDAFGADHGLAAIAVWEDRALIGLALLMTTAGMHARLPATVVQFIGTPLADRLDLLSAPHREEEVAAQVLDTLTAGPLKWDVLSLRELPDFSTTPPALRARAADRGWAYHERPCAYVPVLAVDRSYPELRPAFSADLRRQISKRRRRLEAKGAATLLRRCLRPGDVGEVLDTIVPIEHASWKGAAGVGVFRSARHRAFFRAALEALAAKGVAEVSLFRVDETVISYQLGFRLRGRCYLYNKAFLPAWAAVSPGILLQDALVRDSAAQEEIRVLDASRSMRANPDTLAGCGGGAHTHLELTLYPPRLYARGLHLLHATIAPRLRAWRRGTAAAEGAR